MNPDTLEYSHNYEVSNRLTGVDEYYFSKKLKEIDTLNIEGKNVINLGIGNPDLPPHPDVIEVLQSESCKHSVHGYQGYKGSPILRNAISNWYNLWYNVQLNPDTEILPLMGSKEGIMHICMTFLDENSSVFVPNPGYPTYTSAAKLAGGRVFEYTLSENNNWLPDFAELKKLIDASQEKNASGKTKTTILFLNYPHMPTGQLPTKSMFQEMINFARDNDILLVHDNPYSFILNNEPLSILSIPGAKEVAVELNSISKSHNMAGWRIGMLCGKESIINNVLRFKSNMDSGMFLPLQLAAAKALSSGKEWHDQVNNVYLERREQIFKLLIKLNCSFSPQQAGLFIWAKIPEQFKNGFQFSDDVLYNSNVFITPGGVFGSAGDNYVRVSLCNPVYKINEAIERIKK
jgi:aspartate/methionine/tyrosine aminotransferase